MIIMGRAPGEQICWSEPWTGFLARTTRADGLDIRRTLTWGYGFWRTSRTSRTDPRIRCWTHSFSSSDNLRILGRGHDEQTSMVHPGDLAGVATAMITPRAMTALLPGPRLRVSCSDAIRNNLAGFLGLGRAGGQQNCTFSSLDSVNQPKVT
jgi:hypothetical protein